jgi:hypothetical protein
VGGRKQAGKTSGGPARQGEIPRKTPDASSVSRLRSSGERSEEFLKAALFAGNEKTLFESLNPRGKSDEDIFIESLVAQEYDALNLLARLPKDSELYGVKLKQFQEMSRMRQDLKDKIQKVRLEKVRREFEMERQMTETEKANLQWLDSNRRQMLNREVDILKHNQAQQQREAEASNHADPELPTLSPALRHKQSTHPRHPSDPPGLPSIGRLPEGRLVSQQGRNAYRIVVRGVKGYLSRSPMCVRLQVVEEGEQPGKWTFSTKYHDEAAPKDERNPYNPGVRNRLDEAGQVVFNEALEISEDLQSRYNRSQA